METIYKFQGKVSILHQRQYVYRMVFLLFLMLSVFVCNGQVLIPYGSSWKYAPESYSNLNTTDPSWKNSGYGETGWKEGNAPFGFGGTIPADKPTLISRPKPLEPASSTNKNYPVYFFRNKFNIPDKGAISSLSLTCKYDDAVVIYVNGKEFKSSNYIPNATPGEEDYYGNPTVAATPENYQVTICPDDLVNGENIIAVALHQGGSQSSDVFFNLQLEVGAPHFTRYPYLQLPSHDQMTVRWYTNIPTNSTVRYSTSETMSSPVEVFVNECDTLHNVTLKGLYPSTTYYYLVGYGSGSNFVPLQNKPSATNFHTLPPPWETGSTLRFWLLGDSGAGKKENQRPYKVRDAYLDYWEAMGKPNLDAILFLGDNSNGEILNANEMTVGVEGEQDALDLTIFNFYNQPDNQLLSRIPSWTVMGNHDYEPDRDTKDIPGAANSDLIVKAYYRQNAASFSTFSFPEKGEIGGEPTNNKKGYYSFEQGDVHFVVLNPYLIEGSTATTNPDKSEMWVDPYNGTGNVNVHGKKSISLDDTYDTPIDELEQVKWLKKDLENNKKSWTVVTFHQPPFSTIKHFSDGDNPDKDLVRIREKLMPILEKPEYHVDLLLVSHTHAYLRAGMIRLKQDQTRTTDYQETGGLSGAGNLGRYPTDAPYIKTGNEQAYSYILTGSSGRGFKGNVTLPDGSTKFINDSGYDPNGSETMPVDSWAPALDNLAGDYTTNFYHEQGGSVELLFEENRLDVKFIKEPDATHPDYFVADSYVVMKDVNKTTTKNINKGGDIVKLKASWIGDYHWYSSESPSTELATGERELTLGPYKTTTYYVRDGYGHLEDTFEVNVANPTDPPTNEMLISFGSQWLFPLSAGFSTKGVNLANQCVEPNFFTSPAFEIPTSTTIGLGHGDEATKLSNSLIERIATPAERLWFRRSFILNSSASAYKNFKLTLTLDKNTFNKGGGTTYNSSLQTILVNGQVVSIQSSQSEEIDQGRVQVTYTLNNQGFNYGINYILVSFYITPIGGYYFIDPQKDPFTFNAQLVSTPNTFLSPPPSKQFKLTKTTLPKQTVCAGDSLSVEFSAVGNESNFTLTYQAELVTSTGTTVLAEATKSPILVKLPTSLTGGNYTIRIVTKSAFMDLIETSAIAIRVLPKATVLPTPTTSLWRGQSLKIPVKFEGSGPISFTLPDGSSGTTINSQDTVSFKPDIIGLASYTLKSVSNGCGTGTISGSMQAEVKEPFLTMGKVAGLTTAPFKTALCEGDSISIIYSVIGPSASRSYSVELSDPAGSFTTPAVLGSGTSNPLRVRLPATLSEGSQYRLRMQVANPDVDFTRNASENQTIRKAATASFATDKVAALNNEDVKVTLNFTGSAPWYYFLRFGADTLRGNAAQASLNRTIKLNETQTFSLDSVRNACGYGTVSGGRTVTVSLLVSVDPLSTQGIIAYPNPTSDLLILKNEQGWKQKLQWSISDIEGKSLSEGVISVMPNKLLEINIRSLPVGVYMLQITEGDRRGIWKFVKE